LKLTLLLTLLLIPAMAQTRDATPEGRAVTALQRGAADGDADVRREVAIALGMLPARHSSTDLLEQLAADKDHLVRESAMVSIGELRDRRKAKLALDALDDEVPEVAFAAARTLFKLNQPEGKQLLLDIVEKDVSAKTGFMRAKLRDAARRMKRPKSAMLFVAQHGVGFIPVPGIGQVSRR
jgi:HEAT repeat protein